MKVLVTGSAGFIGSAMVAALEARGDDVAGIDIHDGPQFDALDFFRTDSTRYDLAIHCAAVIGGRQGIDGTPLAVATNLALDSWYLHWLVRTGTPKAVYFSSSAAYPTMWQDDHETARSLHEDDIHLDRNLLGRPDAVYGWAKLTGEHLAAYARAAGVDVLVCRPFSGYGEQQGLAYPFPSIIRRAARREDPLDIWGDGEQVRDWIHIDDVIAGILAALDAGEQGPLNLGTGIPTSFNQLAAAVIEAVGDNYAPSIRHLTDKPTGVAYRVADPARMLTLHTPHVTLQEGIRRALAAFALDVATEMETQPRPSPGDAVDLDDRFAALRRHTAKRHQCDWVELEHDLDRLQNDIAAERHENRAATARLEAELAELLRRVPQPDNTPASVTVTVH